MKLFLFILTCLVLSTASGIFYVKSQSQSNQTSLDCKNCEIIQQSCVVSGRVVDENNQPIAGARVSSLITDRPTSRTYQSITNEQGKFVLNKVQCGNNIILAEKEEDGYINPFLDLSEIGKPLGIIVNEGQPRLDVEIKLGPKSPRLIGRVIDAKTGKSVNDARITICRLDEPKICYSIGVEADGAFNLLTSLLPFTFKVSSPNHADWYYGQDGTKRTLSSFTLASGISHEINISLQPLKK